jgi:hypothetical protein
MAMMSEELIRQFTRDKAALSGSDFAKIFENATEGLFSKGGFVGSTQSDSIAMTKLTPPPLTLDYNFEPTKANTFNTKVIWHQSFQVMRPTDYVIRRDNDNERAAFYASQETGIF